MVLYLHLFLFFRFFKHGLVSPSSLNNDDDGDNYNDDDAANIMIIRIISYFYFSGF